MQIILPDEAWHNRDEVEQLLGSGLIDRAWIDLRL